MSASTIIGTRVRRIAVATLAATAVIGALLAVAYALGRWL